jgi:branched-chain amino acid transport system substrate-binding protein
MRRMPILRAALLALLILIAGVALVACAGGTPAPAEAPGAGEATSPPMAEEPTAEMPSGEEEGPILVVGAVPATGPYASDGQEMIKALEMARDEYNAQGGLLGRQIEVQTGDVGGLEVDKIQAVGERLMGLNPDAVITGYDDSGVNTYVFGEFPQPYLHCVAMRSAAEPVADDPEKYSNVFQYCPTDYDYGVNAAQILPTIPEKIGWEPPNNKVVVIAADYAYNTMAAEKLAEDMEANGYEIVIHEVTPFGVVEWGPMLSRIEDSEASFITFFNLDPTDASRFMIQLTDHFQDIGLDAIVYMQYTPNIPEFLELVGDKADGLFWATTIRERQTLPDVIDYRERWIERYDIEPKGIQPYMVRDAFDIWANAVKQVGCVECFDQVEEAIRSTEYEGFAGIYKFDPTYQTALQGVDYIPTVWSQVWDGQHHIILPEGRAEAGYEWHLPPWIP